MAKFIGPNTTTPAAVASAGASGTSALPARVDHVHAGYGSTNANLSSSTPADVGAPAVGTGTTYARADHVHGTQSGTLSGANGLLQVFSAGAGTWGKPAGDYQWVRVRLVGGGGGGSGGTGAGAGQANGAGGGGGGYVEHIFAIGDLGSTQAVTVGAGGTGRGGATVGDTGVDSTMVVGGVTLTASGGIGGLAGYTASTGSGVSTGGGGGAASGGNVANVAGGDGGAGRTLLGVSTVAAFGGASHMGGQTQQSMSSAVNGVNGSLYGGGGSGGYVAATTRSGGNGAAGIIIIETW